MFSASFRQGITTETSGRRSLSVAGVATGVLVCSSVLIGLGERLVPAAAVGSCLRHVPYNAGRAESGALAVRTREMRC